MARFRGTLKGGRGQASRLGTPNSGLTTQTNGWGRGITVYAQAHGDSDRFYVHVTNGSSQAQDSRCVGYADETGWHPVGEKK